jgi:hypothetical protein
MRIPQVPPHHPPSLVQALSFSPQARLSVLAMNRVEGFLAVRRQRAAHFSGALPHDAT